MTRRALAHRQEIAFGDVIADRPARFFAEQAEAAAPFAAEERGTFPGLVHEVPQQQGERDPRAEARAGR